MRWLKEPLVWADISRPARLSYQILEWLSKLDPLEDADQVSGGSGGGGGSLEGDACDSALFLTPQLAHFSALARSQGLGLRQTNLVLYFEHATTLGRSTLLREELSFEQKVEQQESMFMEATAATLADLTIVDNTGILHELDRQAREYLPTFMRAPSRKATAGAGKRRKQGASAVSPVLQKKGFVHVLPMVGSNSGAREVGGSGGGDKYGPKALLFEGAFTKDNGLTAILDALSEMHTNVTEIGEVEVHFSGSDAWNSRLNYRGDQLPTLHGSQIIKNRLDEMRGYKLGIHSQRTEVAKFKVQGGLRVIVQFSGSGGGVRRVLEAVTQNAPFVAYDSILADFARSVDVSDKKFLDDLKERHGIRDPGHDVRGSLLAANMWAKVKDEVSRKDCVATSKVYKIVSQYIYDVKPAFLNLYKKKVEESQANAPKRTDASHVAISVILVHHNRPDKLQQALKSLMYQTHKKTEIIVIDNASTHPGTEKALGSIESLAPEAKVVKLDLELSLSAARNEGARHATGTHLLFMDDDNVAKPRQVEILAMAAVNTDADVISPGNQYFIGEVDPYGGDKGKNALTPINKWLPLGPSPTVGVYRDCFGDSNSLFKKAAFDQYGGFQEHKDIESSWEGEMAKATGEDWELMARMTLGGSSLQPLPIPLFWYRLSSDALSKSSSRNLYLGKVVSPFLSTVERHAKSSPDLSFLGPVVRAAQESYHKDSLLSPKYNLNGLDKLLDFVRTQAMSQGQHSSCTLENLNERSEIDETKNLLKNSAFEELEIEGASFWESFGDGYEANRYTDGIKVTSRSISDQFGARQVIKLGRKSENPIFIAAQSTKLEGAPSKYLGGYSIYVDLEYADGTMGYGYTIPFSKPPASHVITNETLINGSKRWKCGLIVPTKPVTKIYFHLLFRQQVGSVLFHKSVAKTLNFGDVCRAFLTDPILEAMKQAKSTNATMAGAKNEIEVAAVDCQGHFTRQTPLLF